jgi:hypothetical protein
MGLQLRNSELRCGIMFFGPMPHRASVCNTHAMHVRHLIYIGQWLGRRVASRAGPMRAGRRSLCAHACVALNGFFCRRY